VNKLRFYSRFLLLLAAFSILLNPITAQTDITEIGQDKLGQWIIPLTALGYKTVQLNGQVAKQDLFLPIPAGMQATALQGMFVKSLDVKTGYIEVYSEERLLTQFTIDANEIVIPLEQAVIRHGLLALTLVARLRNQDDICITASTGAWGRIESPVLILNGDVQQPTSVATFLPALLTKVNLIVSKTPTPAEAEAALVLTSMLTSRYAGQQIEFVIASDNRVETESPFERTIVIREDEAGSGVAINSDGQLSLSGSPEQLRQQSGFLAASPELAIAPQVDVVQLTRPEQLREERVSFQTLDFTRLQVSGQGKMEIPLNFSQSDLGGEINTVSVRLAGTYTPVTVTSRGTLSLLFNGTLIKSLSLDNSGQFDLYVALPVELLQRDNTLTAQFDYTPTGGECRIGADTFTGQISGSSYLQITSGKNNLIGFTRFPQNMLNGFTVAFGALDVDALTRAVYTVAALQKTSRSPFTLTVKSWDEALRDQHTALFFTTSSDQIKALNPLMTLEPLRVLDGDGNSLLELQMDAAFAALEAFQQNGRDVLLIAGDATALTAQLTTDTQGWYQLKGDVYLASGTTPPVMLTLQNSALQTQTLSAPVEPWFIQYRFVLFGALLMLVAVFAVLAYPRVVRQTPA
jgi:hypothetical protein